MIAAPATTVQRSGTTQRQFNFGGPWRACLAPVSAVKVFLMCDEDRVLDLIYDRKLVGFDLRGPGAERAFPGIWSRSIRTLCEGDPRLDYGAETATAILDLLPHRREDIRLSEVCRLLCVTSGHLHNLLDSGAIKGIGGDCVSKAPMILRNSLESFLTERRM
jgi:hypothetical protein